MSSSKCREPQRPLTLAQLAAENLLVKIMELPVGSSLTLVDRAGDGLGGLRVQRHSKHTLIFQRTGYQGRSRWADGPDEAREQIAAYVASGRLSRA